MPQPDERLLFDRVVALDASERPAFLDAHCPDPAVRARVLALVAAHERASRQGFLGSTAQSIADAAIGRTGRRLGAYEIVREIGRGGMGAVYLATRADDEYRTQVAIKIVAAPLGDEDLVRRFRRERQILAELTHPRIARLIDGGTTEEGLPYLVMEYVEGQRIDEYCRARRLSIDAKLALFRDVCEAVQYAHSHLIVHRDLKPQNLLVTADGDLRLLDFGIAKLVESEPPAEGGATQTGVLAMTPEYASPEQMTGGRATTASDVYALGVLLHELLTGVRPYDVSSKRVDEIVRIVTDTEPTRPSVAAERQGDHVLSRRLRGDLDTIVLTAIRKEPERRYASVALLAEDVRRYLEGLPISARGEAVGYRTAKFIRRHRLAVLAAAVMLATLVGGIIATTAQARAAEAARRDAEDQRARAERRFADVRRLANSFLFEFHDAVAALPGSTPARQLVVSKALEYLDGLAAEAQGDRVLQAELAAAYDRVGDVQGNPSNANLGDVAGALASYQKAERIRQTLVDADPGALEARLNLVTSTLKVADALISRGAIKEAVDRYRAALEPREQGAREGVPSRDRADIAVAEVTGRLCTTLIALGEVAEAISHCEQNRRQLDALVARAPGDAAARLMQASNRTGFGNALRLTRQTEQAARMFEEAASLFNAFLQDHPTNAEARRRLSVTYAYLANVHLEQKTPRDAAASFGRAIAELDGLVSADPANVRYRTDLSYMLNRRADILMAIGEVTEARRTAGRAITLLREAAERPGASGEAFNEYAWALVSAKPDDLRNPRIALDYATRAIASAGTTPNPTYLHTLAWAHYLLGSQAEAVRQLEAAIAALPAASSGPAVGLRRQVEGDLETFRSRRPPARTAGPPP